MKFDTLETKRPHTYSMKCPGCGAGIEFWSPSGMSDYYPHFYCDRCSNVIWREADRDFLAAKGASEATLKQIVASLPPCPCGGRFDAGACQKCPRCGYVFARPSLPVHRLTDACVMLIEGASFLREPKAGSVS